MAYRPLDVQKYTIGWLCALPIELAAARLLLDKKHEELPYDPNDDTQYTLGSIRDHNVVIGCLSAGEPGIGPAATIATRMRAKFPNLRFGLMVGVGGGVPGKKDVRLGDVVVSQPANGYGGVVQYRFGKYEQDGFVPTGFLNAPPQSLRQALANLQAYHIEENNSVSPYLATFESRANFRRPESEDILFMPTSNHIKDEETCGKCNKSQRADRGSREHNSPVIHYGTIASGDCVMKNGEERDLVSSKFGGVLCFEMEAAGLMNNWPCLVIRGICDYADSHKNKGWQPYAAATAAAYAKEVLSVIPVAEVDKTRTVNEAILSAMIRSAIDGVELGNFLSTLSVASQENHRALDLSLDYNQPKFHWIFRNIDYKKWNSASDSQVLWLSGLPKCNIRQVSSYIVDQEKNRAEKNRASGREHVVLHFFYSSEITRGSIAVHTLLNQIVHCSPIDKRILIVRRFLHSLLEQTFEKEEAPNWNQRGFSEEDSPDTKIEKLLDASVDGLWAALGAVLACEQDRELSIIIDGLEYIQYQRDKFIRGVSSFVEHLQQRTSTVKILLTSRPLAEIRDILDWLPCIEHDRERNECLASLRFNNTRYDKISREYEDTFEWIWAHKEYRNWSTADASRLLYIEGKPGSGKSTITKYFGDHLLEREKATKSALVAKFFYSYREGELQRSHYNMLRSILYDILHQDEALFYHRFQTEYRGQHRRGISVDWEYESLKIALKSLRDHSPAKQLYLIIDAVDESEDNDRRNILNLLFELCAETKYCIVKVFVASRPVGQLEVRKSQFHNFIRLQDETKSDISNFARSFLNRLNLTRLLIQATEYIVENAQGVFLWVKLIGEELLVCEEAGYCEEEIFEFLKRLPTEIEDIYRRMFNKMSGNELALRDGIKMLRFILLGKRPLTVDELLHTLGIPDNPDTKFTPLDDSFQTRIPSEQRIISCGGNFLETKPYHGNVIVQVMHQTVREFFLNPNRDMASSAFRMCEKDAHICISITCIRYLMLCAANTTLARTLPHVEFWTLEHFERYAQYLDKRPLAKYALCYLTHHIEGCQRDANVLDITSQLIDELTHNPVIYLLESWVSSSLNKALPGHEQGTAAKDFRKKVLYAAVRNGFPTAAEVLLTVGANVDERDEESRTPLSWAAGNGHEAVVRLLLAKGAHPDSKSNSDRTPLSWAAENGHEAVVRLLLAEDRVDPNLEDSGSGWTPLCWAAVNGHEAVVKLLLARNDVEADSKDKFGQTPLSWAAGNGHEAVVKLLLAKEAHPDSKSNSDWTPLSRAAKNGHEAVVGLLLARNDVECDRNDPRGRTPLSWAAVNGHEAVVKLLLTRDDVEADSKDKFGQTPLSWAAGNGHEAVVRLLLAKGAHPDSKSNSNRTPLSRAAENGHEAVVRLLLVKDRVDLNSEDYGYGQTPLSWAAVNGHEGVVKLLLARNDVEADSKNKFGQTPLSRAAREGHKAVVKLLLARNDVEADSKDPYLRTPLSRAAAEGHEEVVKLLLARNDVEVDSKDKFEQTPLSRAAAEGREVVVKLLLARNDGNICCSHTRNFVHPFSVPALDIFESPSEEKEKQACLRSLSFATINAQQQDIAIAHPDTCKWIFQTAKFQQWWRRSDLRSHNGVLWIEGKPGAGKSTLMKYTLHHCREFFEDHIIAAYFFNARGDSLEKTITGMLRSLTFQLLDQDPLLYERFLPRFRDKERKYEKREWQEAELKEFLHSEIKSPQLKPLLFLIDALDECGESDMREVVNFLEMISISAVSTNVGLNICLSSRPYPNISMRGLLELTVESEREHSEDISRYIRDNLTKRDKDIEKRILENASGVFMWVTLVVSMLNQVYREGKVKAMHQKLLELPADLEGVFESLTEDNPDMHETMFLLQCVLFTKRALKLEELYFAMMAAINVGHLGAWDRLKVTSEDIQRRITSSSKGLIEIRKGEDKTVQFIHKSVRDFLLRNRRLQTLHPELESDAIGTSHDRLKACCLSYLMIKELPLAKDSSHAKELGFSYPFLEYASTYFLYHAEEAQARGVVQDDFVHWLQQPQGEFERLRSFHNAFENDPTLGCGRGARLLDMLSFHGHYKLVRIALPEKGADVNAQGGAFGNALQATSKGRKKIVAMLPEKGADVNAPGGFSILSPFSFLRWWRWLGRFLFFFFFFLFWWWFW